MPQAQSKKIRLRAFNIKSTDPKVNASSILEKLKPQLEKTKVKDRQMLLNSEDPSAEQDVMCDFSIEDILITGTILRIIPNGTDDHIDHALLNEPKFSMDKITRAAADGAAILKRDSHISTDGINLITDLRAPATVKCIETYLNWLLKTHIFELTPIIRPAPEVKLSQLQDITFSNPVGDLSSAKGTKSKTIAFDKKSFFETLKGLFSDVDSFRDIELEQIISARLILKLKKPKDMTEEEYARKYAAVLKPISDLENVSFKTKTGKTIKSQDLLLERTVNIETTDSGFLSEQQLLKDMAKFLDWIKNEKGNH